MWRNWIPFWQPGVSSYGGDIDLLFIGLLAISLGVALLLFILLLVFAIRYRAGSKADRSHPVRKTWYWEIGWTTLTLLGFLGLFVWGASLYLDVYRDTPDAMPIYVVAKQWMWHVQHQGGQSEINELHIPVHRSVQLIMASQDVIHSFFVPAFRVKHDVVPGRYQNLWFRADKTGEFQLLCAEFCGTDHSRMIGRIVVMEPHDFETWLSHQQAPGTLARAAARPAGTARAGALFLPFDAAPRRRRRPATPPSADALRVQRDAGEASARGAARYRRADRCVCGCRIQPAPSRRCRCPARPPAMGARAPPASQSERCQNIDPRIALIRTRCAELVAA